jgi:hypothetical protein
VAVGARGNEEAGEGFNKPDSKKERKNKMKKLMIAVAAAAVGMAYADPLCGPGEDTPPPGTEIALVYDWQFKGKTTAGWPSNSKSVTAVDCSTEGDDGGGVCGVGTTTTTLIKRVPATFAMAGWTAICECGKLIGDYDGWDGYSFWITKPYQAYFNAALCGQYGMKACCEEAFIHVIGKKETDAEIHSGFYGPSYFVNTSYGQTWTFEYSGLGKYVKRAPFSGVDWCGYYSQFSGAFAGQATASYYINLSKGICSPTVVFNCEDCLAAEVADQPTVVYGTWNVKFNAKKTRAYYSARSTTAAKMTPKWAYYELQ